jgi:hypothetical protein
LFGVLAPPNGNDAEEENGGVDGGFLHRGYSDEVEQALWKAIEATCYAVGNLF